MCVAKILLIRYETTPFKMSYMKILCVKKWNTLNDRLNAVHFTLSQSCKLGLKPRFISNTKKLYFHQLCLWIYMKLSFYKQISTSYSKYTRIYITHFKKKKRMNVDIWVFDLHSLTLKNRLYMHQSPSKIDEILSLSLKYMLCVYLSNIFCFEKH